MEPKKKVKKFTAQMSAQNIQLALAEAKLDFAKTAEKCEDNKFRKKKVR